MLSDDELTRLLRRLEAEASPDVAPIERVFDEVDRERRALKVARRRPFLARLGLQRRSLRWGIQPVALLMVLSLLAGVLLSGLLVGGRPVPVASPQATSAIISVSPAARIALTGRPYALTVFEGGLWVANGNVVSRVDPSRGEIVASIVTGPGRASVGAGGAGLWVASSDGDTVGQLDPATHSITRSVAVESPEFVAVGDDDVWVSSPSTGMVTRIDALSGRIVATILVGNSPSQPTVAAGGIWVPHDCIMVGPRFGTPAVSRIDPTTNSVAARVQGTEQVCARGVLATDGAIWFVDANDGTISRVDPETDAITRTVPIGERAGGLAELAGSVWVTFNPSLSTSGIAQVDPRSGLVTAVLDLGLGPERSTLGLTNVLALGGSLWVAADFFGRPELLRVDLPQ